MKIRQMLVKENKYNVKCPYSMNAEWITVHNTYNDASANNEVQYMINNHNEVSYHFAVDDKEVVQGIPLNRNSWHCGDGGKGEGNRKSIGIEICYSKSGGSRYTKAEQNAIKLIAQLLKERGWGIDRVRKHQDWSGKYCPHRILDEGRWNAFKQAIKAEMEDKKMSKKPDYTGHSFEKSIKKAIAAKVINGYDENTFKPDEPLTRGQFAVILDRLGLLDK